MMSRNKLNHDSLIANIPIFQGLSGPDLYMLEGILKEKEFSKGENIFMEGSDTTGFYIIMKGRVKVFKLSADGKEQILHIAGAKELLGAVSAFSGDPYPAHADAIEKTEAFFFPRRAPQGFSCPDQKGALCCHEHDGQPRKAASAIHKNDRGPFIKGSAGQGRCLSSLPV
jgi:hypothetical protein